MTEAPLPGVSVIVLPTTGSSSVSFSVTVMVDVDMPSAGTVVGLATTLELPVLTAVTLKQASVAPVGAMPGEEATRQYWLAVA